MAWRIDVVAALRDAKAMHALPLSAVVFHPDGRELHVPVDPAQWGDAIIVRKETPASYHLSVVVDDALQGVTHVVRGQDLEAATSLHRLLQILLGLPSPSYLHHRLLTVDGRKLSKSLRDRSLKTLRQEGLSRADVRALIGALD